MQVIWNGNLVHEHEITLNLNTNRGFRYGEGFFETMRIHNLKAPLLEFHWRRMNEAAKMFNFILPFNYQDLENKLSLLCSRNQLQHAIVRIQIFQEGSGNYLAHDHSIVCYAMTIRDFQFTSSKTFDYSGCLEYTLFSKNPFASYKTLNALHYIAMANECKKRKWDTGIALNEQGVAVDACWHAFAVITKGKLFMPIKNAGGVQSCAMSALENMLRSRNKEYHIENLTISHLNEADEIFFINAVDGIVPLLHWQNKQLTIEESKKIAHDFQAFYYF